MPMPKRYESYNGNEDPQHYQFTEPVTVASIAAIQTNIATDIATNIATTNFMFVRRRLM
jgi:hypothetical protein